MIDNNRLTELYSEDELDVLVSIAIRRAEILDDQRSRASQDAWHEVMIYEERLASIIEPSVITGGIARVGSIRAALAAGKRDDATRLAKRFLAEPSLPEERRFAIERVVQEDQEQQALRYPALAKSGHLSELQQWRDAAAKQPRVFPLVA